MGWLPQRPDQRDYKFSLVSEQSVLPVSVDLSVKCPPIQDQGQLGSCHDNQTEVLTLEGWKLFRNVTDEDHLASVNLENQELIFEYPKRLIEIDYSGDMYYGSHKFLDFAVTPDHKMVVRKWNSQTANLNNAYDAIDAKDMGWYQGLMSKVDYHGVVKYDKYTISGVDHKHKLQRSDLNLDVNDWLKFLGIYLAEGTMLKQQKSQMYKIQIAGVKEREKDYIRQVLKNIGVIALELKDRFTFNNQRIFEHMKNMGLLGVKSYDKSVPKFIFSCDSSQIKSFLEGYFMGDGCQQGENKNYYTSSLKMANDLQTLIFLSGKVSNVYVRKPRTSTMKDGRVVCGIHNEHRVSECYVGNLSLDKKKDMEIKTYKGKVYCAEMPTYHTLVTRRNGKILISGNCTAHALGAMYHFVQNKEKQTDYLPSRLFIYYNERLQENTVNSDAGADLRTGLRVLTNIGVPREDLCPYDITKFAKKPLKAAFDNALRHEGLQYHAILQDLTSLKTCLASGYVFVCGVTVYESFQSNAVYENGNVPLPLLTENALGGHAICIIGYDDATSRFKFRNSWGDNWGNHGYGTLPYSYLLNSDLSCDFWTLLSVEKSG